MKLGLLVALVVSGACVLACGDDSSGGGSGGSSSGGSSSGGATANGSVDCGPPGICTPGQVCCYVLASSTSSCAATCEGNATAIACDGPEDCGGQPCCGNVTAGFACSTTESCAGKSVRCHEKVDCPGNEVCVPVLVEGIPLSSCVAM